MNRLGSARARWTRVIVEQEGSGVSVAIFCDGRGIAKSAFYPWKRRLVGRGGLRTIFDLQ